MNIKESIILIIGIISISILSFIGGYAEKSKKIDLPEEIEEISRKWDNPDTLIGYKDNKGVLHIGFKN